MVSARIVVWQEVALIVALGLLLTLASIPGTIANREHKVHNIVLYPNKQSWCTTRNISQVITEPGCKQVTIDNNVCVGACFSYSIPHTEPSDPGEIIGPYCDSCQPSEVSYKPVKVDCTEHPNMKTPYVYKHIQIIHNCTCTACEEQSTANGAGSHRPPVAQLQEQSVPGSGEHRYAPGAAASLSNQQHHHQHPQEGAHGASSASASGSDMIQDDIPEILEVVHYSENDTEPIRHTPVHELQTHAGGTSYLQQQQLNHYEHNSHTDNVKRLLHQKITKLLRSIEATNSATDREQLVEMIRLIKGTSDRNWDELVDSLQSENAILDFDRLRMELVEGEKQEKEEEEEDEVLMTAEKGHHHSVPASTEGDLLTINRVPHQQHQHQQHQEDGDGETDEEDDGEQEKAKEDGSPGKDLPQTGVVEQDGGDHRRLMQHQYSALRLHRPPPVEGGVAGNAQDQQHQHHHHHVVGERVDAHHHLGWGPHGALVIRANEEDLEEHRSIQNGHEIQEKINIHAHELKPNLAGTIMTYDHRSVRDGTGAAAHDPKHDHSSHVKHGLGAEQQQQQQQHHHQHPNHNHHLHQHHHHSQRHGQRTEGEHKPELALGGGYHQKAHGQENQHQQHTQHHVAHPGSHGSSPAGGVANGDNQ
uniref:Putative conserved secreted protein n=1 Tax=Anopheles triannulatus TaxID=58253 RepID=A0A2M4AD87_9DIPT